MNKDGFITKEEFKKVSLLDYDENLQNNQSGECGMQPS